MAPFARVIFTKAARAAVVVFGPRVRSELRRLRSGNRYFNLVFAHHQFISNIPAVERAPSALNIYFVTVHLGDEVSSRREQQDRLSYFLRKIDGNPKGRRFFGTTASAP